MENKDTLLGIIDGYAFLREEDPGCNTYMRSVPVVPLGTGETSVLRMRGVDPALQAVLIHIASCIKRVEIGESRELKPNELKQMSDMILKHAIAYFDGDPYGRCLLSDVDLARDLESENGADDLSVFACKLIEIMNRRPILRRGVSQLPYTPHCAAAGLLMGMQFKGGVRCHGISDVLNILQLSLPARVRGVKDVDASMNNKGNIRISKNKLSQLMKVVSLRGKKGAPVILMNAKRLHDLDLRFLPPTALLISIKNDGDDVLLTHLFTANDLLKDRDLLIRLGEEEVVVLNVGLNLKVRSDSAFRKMLNRWKEYAGSMPLLQEIVRNISDVHGKTTAFFRQHGLLDLGAVADDPLPLSFSDVFGEVDKAHDFTETPMTDMVFVDNDGIRNDVGVCALEDVTPPHDPVLVGTGGSENLSAFFVGDAVPDSVADTVIDVDFGLDIQSRYVDSSLEDTSFMNSILSSEYFSSVAVDLISVIKALNEYDAKIADAYIGIVNDGIKKIRSLDVKLLLSRIVGALQNVHGALIDELKGDYVSALEVASLARANIDGIRSNAPEVNGFLVVLKELVNAMMIRLVAQTTSEEEEG